MDPENDDNDDDNGHNNNVRLVQYGDTRSHEKKNHRQWEGIF